MTPHAHELVGPFPSDRIPEEYDQLRRRVLWAMPAGIYLLGSRAGERRNLMTTSWVGQLAREPKLLGVSVERDARTHELIATGRCFTVSLLDRADRAAIRRFVRPAEDDPAAGTLGGMRYRDAPVSGAPVPEVARAFLDCALEREVELGSHTLFVGEIVDAALGDGVAERSADGGALGFDVLRMEDTRMSYGG